MGAIVTKHFTVSSWDKVKGAEAHRVAVELFGDEQVSPLSKVMINGWVHFSIWSTGSKVGWIDALVHDDKIDKFLAWMEDKKRQRGHSSFQWSIVHINDYNDVDLVEACEGVRIVKKKAKS